MPRHYARGRLVQGERDRKGSKPLTSWTKAPKCARPRLVIVGPLDRPQKAQATVAAGAQEHGSRHRLGEGEAHVH